MSTTNGEERPDPDEVEPIGQSEGVYQRDSNGELRALKGVVEWSGEWRRIEYYPMPIGDVHQYRELGVDVDMEKLAEILAEKVADPDRTVQEWLDTEPTQFNAIMDFLTEEAVGVTPSSEFHAEVREELEAREAAEEGN